MRPRLANQNIARRKSESGFILVVVLWILAALASSYSVYVGNAAFATQVNDDRLRIRNAISTGIELTAYQLLVGPEKSRPPQGAFTVRLSRSTIDVTFISEGARVDLNTAPKGLLEGLFAAVG
jgi:general secretion pathway protein K